MESNSDIIYFNISGASHPSNKIIIESLAIPIVEYTAITENK